MTVSSDEKTAFWAGMLAPFAIAAWVLPVVFLRAWVIVKVWDWYFIPAFGVTPLRMVYAFGISVMAALLVPSRSSDKVKGASLFVVTFVSPLVSLFMAWIGAFFL